jgi:hypothetical protein
MDFTPRPAPKDAPVPAPTAQELPAKKPKASSTNRSEIQNKVRLIKFSTLRAKFWREITPSFILPNVNLNELESQRRNRPADVANANAKMEAMESQEADACSGRWYDQSGRLLVAVFADHIFQVSSAQDLLSPNLTVRSMRELRQKKALLKTLHRRLKRIFSLTQFRAEQKRMSNEPRSKAKLFISVLVSW